MIDEIKKCVVVYHSVDKSPIGHCDDKIVFSSKFGFPEFNIKNNYKHRPISIHLICNGEIIARYPKEFENVENVLLTNIVQKIIEQVYTTIDIEIGTFDLTKGNIPANCFYFDEFGKYMCINFPPTSDEITVVDMIISNINMLSEKEKSQLYKKLGVCECF